MQKETQEKLDKELTKEQKGTMGKMSLWQVQRLTNLTTNLYNSSCVNCQAKMISKKVKVFSDLCDCCRSDPKIFKIFENIQDLNRVIKK